MEPITVLIVDDQPMVRRGLQAFLECEEDISVVGEASNGEEAIQKVQELLPDVVLMDLVMEDMDGIAATRQITQVSPNCRVLILTNYDEDDKVYHSIKAGAMGYLLKDVPAEDLIRAIRSIANGEFHLHPRIARKVLSELIPDRYGNSDLTGLTSRENEVLKLVAKGRTNKEIALLLTISIKTVKAHVGNILSKLHMIDRTQAMQYALKQGLISPEDNPPDPSRS
jgi:DNA-binding NarL/FixJ family response regulator